MARTTLAVTYNGLVPDVPDARVPPLHGEGDHHEELRRTEAVGVGLYTDGV